MDTGDHSPEIRNSQGRSPDLVYAFLPVSHGATSSIRLLSLYSPPGDSLSLERDGEPGEPPLFATLGVVSLAQHPRYTALSYVWGGGSDSRYKLHVNGAQMDLTRNCYLALSSLVKKHGRIVVWVDYVCINQRDESEKAGQIALMGEIYTWAASTFIWLGEGSSRGIHADHGMSRLDDALFVNTFSAQIYRTPRELWIDMLLFYPIKMAFVRPWNVLRCNMSGKSFDIRDIEHMLDCVWLERLWTFQELMLSSNPIIVFGDDFIPWSSFVASIVRHPEGPIPDIARSRWVTLIQTWMSIDRPLYWRGHRMRCTGLFNLFFGWIWSGTAASTSFRDHWLGSEAAKTTIALCFCGLVLSAVLFTIVGLDPATFDRNLFDLNTAYAGFALCMSILYIWTALFASIPVITPKDIYGVLPETAVSAATLRTVRYSQGGSSQDRYFAVQGVLQTLGLNVTPVPAGASLPAVYRTFFSDLLMWNSLNVLLDAGLPSFESHPSWVPRFDLSSSKKWIDMAYLENAKCQVYPNPPACNCPSFDPRYAGQRRSCPECQRYYKGIIYRNCLIICGAYVDTIAVQCAELEDTGVADDWNCDISKELWNLKLILTFFRNVSINFVAQSKFKDLSLRIMQMVYACPDDKISADRRRSFEAWFYLLKQYFGLVKDEETLQACLQELQVNESSWQTHQDICASFINQRSCFLTKHMRVGCASLFAQPGDVIIVVPTVAMPLVVRPVSPGYWQLIGPAFISGMMSGEPRTCEKPETMVLV